MNSLHAQFRWILSFRSGATVLLDCNVDFSSPFRSSCGSFRSTLDVPRRFTCGDVCVGGVPSLLSTWVSIHPDRSHPHPREFLLTILLEEEDARKGTQRNSHGWMRATQVWARYSGKRMAQKRRTKREGGRKSHGNEGSLAKSDPHRSRLQRTAEGVPTQQWKRR